MQTRYVGMRTVHNGYNGATVKLAVCADLETGGYYGVSPFGFFRFDSLYQIATAPDSDTTTFDSRVEGR